MHTGVYDKHDISIHIWDADTPSMRAEAVVQLLALDSVEGRRFSLTSTEGKGPGQDAAAWAKLFASAT